MDCAFGLATKDYVIIAADQSVAYSIMRTKSDEDKILLLDDNKLMAIAGEASDRNQFGEYLRKNIHLFKFRQG